MLPFEYTLPEERIAQRPVYPYHNARLLRVPLRAQEPLEDSNFLQLPSYLRSGDILVFNETKVVPARLFGQKKSTGAKVELLVLEMQGTHHLCLGRPLRRLPVGELIDFGSGLEGLVLSRPAEDRILIDFRSNDSNLPVSMLLPKVATMPIPPYIREGRGDERDWQDYQSLWARVPGSVAAPTASLHFTPELLEQLKSASIQLETVLLHVGPASFIQLADPGEEVTRPPAAERAEVSPQTLERLQQARKSGARVIAVGTTVTRALESAASGVLKDGSTELFIHPGYSFKVIDGLITNFHQPRTTHLMLVEALLGRQRLAESYNFALHALYRFLSYGDGMLIL